MIFRFSWIGSYYYVLQSKWINCKQCAGRSPAYWVTILVDNIRVKNLEQLAANRDLKLSGMVTWVGRSSLEVSVRLDLLRPTAAAASTSPLADDADDADNEIAASSHPASAPAPASTDSNGASAPEGMTWERLIDAQYVMVLRDIFTQVGDCVGDSGDCSVLVRIDFY